MGATSLRWYQIPGGLRRGGLTPACGSAHARQTGSKRSGEGSYKRQIIAKGYDLVLNHIDEVERVWRGFECIEGRKQWNGREDEKSMMSIVSYASYVRVPVGSMAGLPNHLVYLERTAAVSTFLASHCCCINIFSSSTIRTWTYLLSSPLYASTPMHVCIGHETHESRSLQH